MSIAPPQTGAVYAQNDGYQLREFRRSLAPLVATWVRDARELFWLAPKTAPPLTAAKVVEWTIPGGRPMLFYDRHQSGPRGYVELNPMPQHRFHLWMGHCIVRPEDRGLGLGREMVRLLLHEAFERRRATAVSLVVFPDNATAIRCYRNVGFHQVGEQLKFFATTGRQHCMYEMRISREQYQVATAIARQDNRE